METSSTLPANKIDPTLNKKLNIAPVADVTSIYQNAISSSLPQMAQTSQEAQNLASAEQAQKEAFAQAQGQSSVISSLQQQIGNKGVDLLQEQQNQGLETAQSSVQQYAQQLADLNAQASSLQREAQAIPIQTGIQYRGTAGTQEQTQNVSRDLLQQNALKALSLAQQADIASASLTGSQLKLQAAKDKAEQIVNLKYAQKEAELKARETTLNSIKDYVLTPAQEKRREAQLALVSKQKEEIALQKENDSKIQDLIINGSQQGAPADILSKAQKARTPTEAAQILGRYAGNFIQNEYIKSQTAKNYADALAQRIAAQEKQTKGTQSSPEVIAERTKQVQQASSILSLVKDISNLRSSSGFQIGGVGTYSLLNAIPGTQGKTLELTVDQLKNALALPNLNQLKGAMSDKDIMFLKNIATKLDTGLSPAEFDAELVKVQDTFNNVLSSNGVDTKKMTEDYVKSDIKARQEAQTQQAKKQQFLNGL